MTRGLLTLLFASAFFLGDTTAAEVPTVGVSQPIEHETADYEFIGRIQPSQIVEVRARVSGIVDKVHCRAGANVKKDDLLFELNADTFNKALEAAQANLKKRETSLEQETKKVEKLEKDKAKAEDLAKARAERDVAAAFVQLARLELERAQSDRDQTRIKAPLAGRIVNPLVGKGDRVGTLGGTPLCSIAKLDPVHVVFDVDENSLLRLQRLTRESKGKVAELLRIPVLVGLPDEKGLPHKGTIESIDNRPDPKTNRLPFRATLANADGKLSDEALAPEEKKHPVRVRLSVGEPRKVLLIPAGIAASDATRANFVYIVNDHDVVESRTVKLGALVDGLQIVEDGLKPADRVITVAETAKRDPNDKTLSPDDFIKDLRTQGIKPGTTVAPIRITLTAPGNK